jgi:hypothetical protein
MGAKADIDVTDLAKPTTPASEVAKARKERGTGSGYKRRMQRRVVSVLWFLVVLFVIVYVPPALIEPVVARLSTNRWVLALARLLLAVPLVPLLGWILFAQDHLPYGTSKASHFFRQYYVTVYARKKFSLDKSQATTLWFDYFNKWEAEDHPLHDYYRVNFERTYAVRMIYYLKRILVVFVILGCGSAFVASLALQAERDWLPLRIAIVVVAAFFLAWLQQANRATRCSDATEAWEATGVYAKYKEICGILRVKFVEHLKTRSATT